MPPSQHKSKASKALKGAFKKSKGAPAKKKAKVAKEDPTEEDDGRFSDRDVEESEEEEEEVLSSEDEEEDDIEANANTTNTTNNTDDSENSDSDSSDRPTETDLALQLGVDPDLILPSPTSTGSYINKQRCLTISTRGVTSRHRHLLEDLRTLIPHMKKDSKLDEKQNISKAVNEIAEVKSCNSAVFLECRKRQDVYLWAGLTPNGPSVKFHLTNIHTMDELKLTGNCLKGSRPLLSFDGSFGLDGEEHYKCIKEILTEVFGTPRGHPKSKPFCDRVMSFYVADNKIWVRNYQIIEQEATNAKEARQKKLEMGLDTSLVEIGPRFVLDPIRIFGGSFEGQTLYQNPAFVSPNTVRSNEQKGKGKAYQSRKMQDERGKKRKGEVMGSVKEDPLKNVFR
ncbi:hypothetical protein TrST_g2525 [Triparma strigata]|uniref:Brix domain-containing protein n=1 Tax=Triparma strigata TaxID=1606541 RepID=A0A9W7AJM3_9STRA|nr:hypothetical protein TrST_g2525 [Triparma strigata]